MIYNIYQQKMGGLQSAIDKLNRRAVKLKVSPITLEVKSETILEEYTILSQDNMSCNKIQAWFPLNHTFPVNNTLAPEKTGKVTKRFEIEIIGETPKFDGWAFAATIQTTEAGNILRTSPEFEGQLDKAYRDCKPECEHCKVNRYRKDTFIVVHDNGTQKQVGHQCLGDFLGHANPNDLAAQAEMMFSLHELCRESEEYDFDGEFGSRQPEMVLTDKFLSFVAELTLQEGYFSAKQVQEGKAKISTSHLALTHIFPPRNSEFKPIVPSEPAIELASNARQFVLDTLETKEDLTDFEHSLLVTAKLEAIELRACGISAYIVAYYKREQEKAIERANKPVSVHFGAVGTRYKRQSFTYLGSNSFESAYGICWLHRLLTLEGNIAIWKTGDGSLANGNPGRQVILDYSVKEHGEFKGTKQTVITRCKIME